MNHTPGPWLVSAEGHGPFSETRMHCLQCVLDNKLGDAEKDCALIAAAPDLLEACERMVFDFEATRLAIGYEAALKEFCDAKRQARIAILKANGKDNA